MLVPLGTTEGRQHKDCGSVGSGKPVQHATTHERDVSGAPSLSSSDDEQIESAECVEVPLALVRLLWRFAFSMSSWDEHGCSSAQGSYSLVPLKTHQHDTRKPSMACNAKQVPGDAGRPRVSPLAYMCLECKHMPKDDFVWFALDCHGRRKKSSERIADVLCANC